MYLIFSYSIAQIYLSVYYYFSRVVTSRPRPSRLRRATLPLGRGRARIAPAHMAAPIAPDNTFEACWSGATMPRKFSSRQRRRTPSRLCRQPPGRGVRSLRVRFAHPPPLLRGGKVDNKPPSPCQPTADIPPLRPGEGQDEFILPA